jgi:hypothetical protein
MTSRWSARTYARKKNEIAVKLSIVEGIQVLQSARTDLAAEQGTPVPTV